MRSVNDNNRINKVVDNALKNLGEIIDSNTIIGKEIITKEGDSITPISKVTFAVLSGGGEYGKINVFKNSKDLPFSAGNGAIVSLNPCGFLVKQNGQYKILSVSTNKFDNLIEKTEEYILKLTNKEQ